MTPPPWVVDASTAIAAQFQETYTDAARSVFATAHQRNIQLVAPAFWALECGNVCWVLVRRRSIAVEEARAAFGSLMLFPVTHINTDHLQETALDLSLLYGITTYDALYVATAMFTGGMLITADQRLVSALREGGYPDAVVHVSEFR